MTREIQDQFAVRQVSEKDQRARAKRAWRERGWFDAKNGKPRRSREDVLRFASEEMWRLYVAGYRAGASG